MNIFKFKKKSCFFFLNMIATVTNLQAQQIKVEQPPESFHRTQELFDYIVKEKEELKPVMGALPITISGYVKPTAYVDSRQVIGITDDVALFFPRRKEPDAIGNDINAKAQFTSLAVESRLRTAVKGPKINGFNTSGIIEADFFARANVLIGLFNIFRLRLAYAQFASKKWEITAGQQWTPLATFECFPDVVSFNSGLLFDPGTRAVALKAIYHINENVDFITSAASQLVTDGPDGFLTEYQRLGAIPNFHAQILYRFGSHVTGFGLDYKRFVPRLKTNTNYKAEEAINSFTGIAYLALNWENISTHFKFTFAQNGTDQGLIGGYAVHKVDPVTDRRTYTNINAVAIWSDLVLFRNKKIEPAVFFGFTKNIGSRTTVLPDIVGPDGIVIERRNFGLDPHIDFALRLSPRVRWRIGNIIVAGELEFTRTAFGNIGPKGKIENAQGVNNIRLLGAVFYYF